MKLLLASKSPRRRELIAQLGYPVETVSLDVDEHTDGQLAADQVAETLAQRKAAAYDADTLVDDAVLVTADTVVVLQGRVLGKPASREEALAMLHNLSGGWHTVYTGVCLRNRQRSTSFTEATRVHFLPLPSPIIEHYVDTYRPYDKAGAYGIQEWIGMVGIDTIEGCYYNVMGLPLARLFHELQSFA